MTRCQDTHHGPPGRARCAYLKSVSAPARAIAAKQIGGAGRLETQGPPVLATYADLGELHLAARLLTLATMLRHDVHLAGQYSAHAPY